MQSVLKGKVHILVAWGMALSWLCSCAPEINVRSVHNLDKKYEEELLRWTRGDRIYYSLDRIMFVYATYLSPEFRQEFKDQYVRFFGMNPEKIDTDLETVATSTGTGHEFFLFADTPENGWNNLDERDSVWRVGLWGGSQQSGLDPVVIKRFHDRGPNVRAFFPFMNDFGRAYLVTFPTQQTNGEQLPGSDSELSIKVSSALGTAVMSWKVSK
jgi:hypothetical protein